MTQEEILMRLEGRLFMETTNADRVRCDVVEAIQALEKRRELGEEVLGAHREVAGMVEQWLLQS